MEHKIVGIDECRCRKCGKIIKKNSSQCPFCGLSRGQAQEGSGARHQESGGRRQASGASSRGFSYRGSGGGLLLGCLLAVLGIFWAFSSLIFGLLRLIFGGFR